MAANLSEAIDKWRGTTYRNNEKFQTELSTLYKNLVDATRPMVAADSNNADVRLPNGASLSSPEEEKQLRDFLAEESNHMDVCVRWNLLLTSIEKTAALNSSTNAAEKSRPHVKLATMILESDEAGEDLLFYPLPDARFQRRCQWRPENVSAGDKSAKPSAQDKPGRTAGKPDAKLQGQPDRMGLGLGQGQDPSKMTPSTAPPHAGTSGKITIFRTAVAKGYVYLDVLLKTVEEVLRKKGSSTTVSDILCAKGSDPRKDKGAEFRKDIVKYAETASVPFAKVLAMVPNIITEKHVKLLNTIISGSLRVLADVILKSERHRTLLTNLDRVVVALETWLIEDEDDDDKDDSFFGLYFKGSNVARSSDGTIPKQERCRDFVCMVLSYAPIEVLQAPQVLLILMKNNLFGDPAIRYAFNQNESASPNKRDRRDKDKDDFRFGVFLENVPGILQMAIHYQQDGLVDALLRLRPSLAIKRARLQRINGELTVPPREGAIGKPLRRVDTFDTAAVTNGNGVNGMNGVNGVSADKALSEAGYFPLWFNNQKVERAGEDEDREKGRDRDRDRKPNLSLGGHSRDRIGSALVYCTMRHAQNVQTLLTILRESKDSAEPEKEINFDMSRFLIEGTSVADFVSSMPRKERSLGLIQYEETIRYAEFPVLDHSTHTQTPVQNRQRSHLEYTHREIFDMLDWLSDRGVHRIITLRVPDRMARPHDELEIAKVVKKFRVEVLDWRILDLSLDIFRPYGRHQDIPLSCDVNMPEHRTYLRELYLYTGGRRMALEQWFGDNGLRSMYLDNVYITVIKELTTREQCDDILLYIRTKMSELESRPGVNPKMKVHVHADFWTTQTETPRLQEIIHHLSPRLAQFITCYRQAAHECVNRKTFRPVKVAIIDNGILGIDTPSTPHVPGTPHHAEPSSSTAAKNNFDAATNLNMSSSERHLQSPDFLKPDSLWARVCEGKSFVYDQDRVSPWYIASNAHGTQMANLVCAIDPLCQLFVARIADGHYGYSAKRAADAVLWAIDRNVDIISMSFTTPEDLDVFRAAVNTAMAAGIIVVCSHHDEGSRVSTKLYPVGYGGGDHGNAMLRMASCNMYGKLLYDWEDNAAKNTGGDHDLQYDFCVNSKDIAVGTIPFLAKSEDHISGSSVATAITAGVCSLLIACLRTLDAIPLGSDKPDHLKEMKRRVSAALITNKRPKYADVVDYLKTMAPSKTNPQFISLDRFASLDELRDVNQDSLSRALLELGYNFKKL